PLARYGPYRGTGVSNGNLIGDSRGLDNTPETTLFYLNVKRQGSLFKFYIGRWRNHKHVNVWSETFNDLNGDFLGRLKFISLYITTFSDRPTPNRLRINSVEVFELKQLTVDQTPYILRAGDELIIDHESEGVFINGINAMPLKHFGSDFFELPNGYSSINIHPDDAFEGTIRIRERYKLGVDNMSKEFPDIAFVNVDGQAVPFTKPQHYKKGSTTDTLLTGEDNPLPTKDESVEARLQAIEQTQSQILDKLNDTNDTRLTESKVGYSYEEKPEGNRNDQFLELDTKDDYFHDGVEWVKW